MKFRINNFGPVRGKQEYIIDLEKDITLITGENGLGKTYLGYIFYGLIKVFSSFNFFDIIDQIWVKFIAKEIDNNYAYLIFNFDLFNEYIDKYLQHFKENININMGIDKKTSTSIFKDIEIEIIDREDIYSKFIKRGIEDIFLGSIKINLKKKANDNKIEIFFTEKKQAELIPLIVYLIFRQIIVTDYIKNLTFIPVERNSINTFIKEFLANRFELTNNYQKDFYDVDNVSYDIRKKIGRYPEVIEDNIRLAQDLTQLSKYDADEVFIKIANEIESKLLKGEIEINKEGEVEFKPFAKKSQRIPVHLSASFIKTISSIVFFLKHTAHKGDMLMIDEPEMNLHPNLQIIIVRLLVQISNAGVKIWVSTHSDYIISELNNLCLVGYLKSNSISNEFITSNYSENEYIDTNKMQVLYLNDKKTKTQVKIENLPIKPNGIIIETIDDTLYHLNERTNELNELYEENC